MHCLLSGQIGDFAAIYDEEVELVSVARPASGFPRRSRRAPVRIAPACADPMGAGCARCRSANGRPLRVYRCRLAWRAERGDHVRQRHAQRAGGLRANRSPGDDVASPDVPPLFTWTTYRAACSSRSKDPARNGLRTGTLTDRFWPPPTRTRCLSDAAEKSSAWPRGNWSLLKGGAWDDRFDGVVHRSPHEAGERLLLSFDPIFTDPGSEPSSRKATRP